MKDTDIDGGRKSSSRDYLYALVQFPSYIELVADEQKPFHSFLVWLLAYSDRFRRNEDEPLMAIKEIAKQTGIDVGKIPRFLKAIYDDIFRINETDPKRFVKPGQVQCWIGFRYLNFYAPFILGLDLLPRKGEDIDFWFAKPKCGTGIFSVEYVTHEIKNGAQQFAISVGMGDQNLYLRLLKEKAYLHGEISPMEFIQTTTSDLEERLIRHNKHL